MLHVADAIELIRARTARLGCEEVPLAQALGRALAADVASAEDLPAFDNSAVDGYAVHSIDLAGASPEVPTTLPCEVTISAGQADVAPLPPGRVARIGTGAPLPVGADAVVPVECTAHDETGQVMFVGQPAVGANRRLRGCDLHRDAPVLTQGAVLHAADLMLLAALGRTSATVACRPRVALITTGDEVVPHDQQPGPGQVRDSNLLGLPLVLEQAGADVAFTCHVADSAGELAGVLSTLQGFDMVLTVGGVSMGEADAVRPAIDRLGRVEFWRVAVKPGKPLLFGSLGPAVFFGLPGNPVSALVTIDLFVRPALDAMLGRLGGRRVVTGVWAEAVPSDAKRAEYVRVVAEPDESGSLLARHTGNQSSGRLTTMLGANAYGVIPVGVGAVARGDVAQIEFFEPGVLA